MLFSIITVCFNSAKTIGETIDSLLSQSCNDYEYIIVDGGSTDGTMDIIKEYEPKFEGRMHWISEQDKGIYDAMNKGIKMAKGEYVNFMNSDDCLEDDCLNKVKCWISEHPGIDIYYGITLNMRHDGQEQYLMRVHHSCLCQGKMICHQSIFMSIEVFKKIGDFRINYKIIADHELLLRAQKNNCSYQPMPFVVCHFRWGGFSTEESILLEYKKELRDLLIEYGFKDAKVEKHQEQIKKMELLIHKVVLGGYKCVKWFLVPINNFFNIK